MRLTFTIQRFNPEVDSAAHPQDFRLEVARGTTVLDALSGFARPTSGRLILDGVDLAGRPARQRAGAGVVRTFQAGGLFPRLTLRDNIDLARRWHRLPPLDEDLAAATGLGPYLHRPAAALPHGTARVGEITRALCLGPRVLLLDEPAGGLSRKEAEALIALVRRRKLADL